MAKVLIAVDGSEASTQAAEAAVKLLGSAHEYVVLEAFHVPVPAVTATVGVYAPLTLPPSPEVLMQAGEVAAREAGSDVAAVIRRLGVAARNEVRPGRAAEVIREVARDEPADLVVVGSHGKGWAARVVMGSVSHDLLRQLPCAVLVVPVGPAE